MLSSSEGSYTPIVDIVDEHGHDPGSRDGSRILCLKLKMPIVMNRNLEMLHSDHPSSRKMLQGKHELQLRPSRTRV